MMINKLEYGIHTYSVEKILTYKQYKKVKKMCLDSGKVTVDSNIIAGIEPYFYYGFAEYGIKLYLIGLSAKIYQLRVQIEPCRVLGAPDPTALFRVNNRQYRALVKKVDAQLEKLSVPGSVDEMKINRCDVTINVSFDDHNILLEYLRILKKGYVPKRFEVITFKKNEGKAKDWKSANKTSYCISSKNERFLIYDKIAQLEMIKRCDKGLTNRNILRFEAELQRKALKKYLGTAAMQSNQDLLFAAMDKAQPIIRGYFHKMNLDCNAHLRYADVVSQIEGTMMRAKTKEHMLYLIKKTSDGINLNSALNKIQDNLGISKRQANQILDKFRQLGISPVTLRNGSAFQDLPSLLHIV